MRRLNAEWSDDGINRLIAALEVTKVEATRQFYKMLGDVAKDGEKFAKQRLNMYLASYDLGEPWQTGFLESSITHVAKLMGKVQAVVALAPYAIYVEFGTGRVGDSNPHPMGLSSEYRDTPWRYFNTYFGRMIKTSGRPSMPFMHDTMMFMIDELDWRIADANK